MIQRVQTLWLLLVAILAAITFRFPFYTGDWLGDAFPITVDLNARTTVYLTILTVLNGVIAFVSIFLFGNRKIQFRLSLLGIFLSAILLVLYFLEVANFANGSIALWCVFYFGILAAYILATRGIWKDMRLVKSMDRLR